MANIINTLDRADARVTNWLDDNYPTFIYRFIAGVSWAFTSCGVFLVGVSYWSHSAYDVFAGLSVTIGGTVVSTLLTLWSRNEIATLRHKGRRAHPSYPYKGVGKS
jgi:hypothetical protein